MTNERILIFIPTYNESENVERMHAEIRRLAIDADLLFMDDNSEDGTGAKLDRIAAADPRTSVIHRAGKLGIGSAHVDGITHAYQTGYDRLVTMDCDFTHSPADIPRMLAASREADIAIGSRYMQANSLPGWSLTRRFLTQFGHFLTKTFLKIGCDASGAFRVYNLHTIPLRIFQSVNSKSYSFFFESLFLLTNNSCTIKEIPIVLPARTYGHSKMSFREATRSGVFLMKLWTEKLVNPRRFQVARKLDATNPELHDPQNWDPYWNRKHEASSLIYEIVAALYRKMIIKRNLENVLHRHFPESARLLHGGCGSGQVDVDLHKRFRITAIDISLGALDLYAKNNPGAERIEQADILHLPYPDSSFDGSYSLGVVEHFSPEEISAILRELNRVTKPGGKVVIFWPHRRATSVAILKAMHFLMHRVLKKPVQFHPPEPSLLRSKNEAAGVISHASFALKDYSFGPRDFFVQAVVVGEKLA
ncbi:MAG: glycosyltransferase [Chthoniobacterales bacterium]